MNCKKILKYQNFHQLIFPHLSTWQYILNLSIDGHNTTKLILSPFEKTSVKSTLSVPPNVETITILSEAGSTYFLITATLML